MNLVYVSSNTGKIFEFNSKDFKLTRVFNTDYKKITGMIYEDDENKLYCLEENCILSIKVLIDCDDILIDIVHEGKYSDFKYSRKEWILGRENGEVIRIDSEGKRETTQLGGAIKKIKYSRSSKFILALESNNVHELSMDLKSKKTFTVDFIPLHIVVLDDDKRIILSSGDGKIAVIDKISNQVVTIPVHKGKIAKFLVDSKAKKIISFGHDSRIGRFNIPKFKNSLSLECKHTNFVFYGFHLQIIFVEENKSVKIWNLRQNTTKILYEAEQISEALCYIIPKELLVFSDTYDLIFYKVELENVQFRIPFRNKVFLTNMHSDEGDYIFTLANENTFIYIYDINKKAEHGHLFGHGSKITCILNIPKTTIIATGSNDKKIIIWDYMNVVKKKTLVGHEDHITSIFHTRESNKIISGSKDGNIKVWNWRIGVLIITLNFHTRPITTVWVNKKNVLISLSSDGLLINWNLRTYTKIFANKISMQEAKFAINQSSEVIVYSNFSKILIGDLPGVYEKLEVVGPAMQDRYEYMNYILKVLKGEKIAHNPKWDDWIVFPYLFDTMHFYSYRNLHEQLKMSLSSGSFLKPSLYTDPYSMVINKNYQKSLKIFIDNNKKILRKNLYALNFLSESTIIKLNLQGHNQLNRFYETIFKKYVPEKFPKFAKQQDLPKFIFSKSLQPLKKEFFSSKSIQKNDRENDLIINPEEELIELEDAIYSSSDFGKQMVPFIIYISCIRFNFYDGSRESVDFISSLLQCPNKEIFRTKFIQSILKVKWSKFKVYQNIQAGVYLVYLMILSIYLAFYYKPGDKAAAIFLFIISVVLSLYDAYQIFVSFKLFWRDIWNYFDILRLICIITYMFLLFNDMSQRRSAMIILTMISFMRGASFFRLFDETRYMIQLLISVVKDVRPFAIVLMYSILSFSIMFMVQDDEFVELDNDSVPKGYLDYLEYAFIFILGQIDSSGNKDFFGWIIFIMATVTNITILLNMLIALMGETFNNVRENIELADYIEIAGMVLEVETSLYANRKLGTKTYFQMCEAENISDKADVMADDIKEIKKILRGIANEKDIKKNNS